MFTQILRKSVILLAIYVLLIVGIFTAQFKNDSIISEKFGNLHVSLLASTISDEQVVLKNKFNILFNGITLNGNDDKPVRATVNSEIKNVSLVSWERISNLSCKLIFSENIQLLFCISDEGPKAFMNIIATFPDNISGISIPYGVAAGSTISSIADSKLQIVNKKIDWELSAADIETDRIFITSKEKLVSYSYFDKNRAFSFAAAEKIDNASESAYNNVIDSFVFNLINAYTQAVSDSGSSIGEQETVSYVAAMAAAGRYNVALDTVPADFKKSSSRTFFSAPYFGTLIKVNEALNLQINSYADLIQRAKDSSSYDIFGAKFLVDYMCMHPGSTAIKALLEKTAASTFDDVSVVHAANILNVYNELTLKNPSLANVLQPVIQKCIDKIQLACILDNNNITMAEKGTFLTVMQAVLVGDSLYRYGKIIKNKDYIFCGRLIIDSYLRDNSSFDLKTLAELYPVIIHGNTYYPHFEILVFEKGQAIWAWTCANKVNYVNDNAGTVSLAIDFPQSLTHYLIINGIEAFKSIYIYDLAFRSDYRFETYNSSGYIYQNDTKSLLLKSRHKANVENVRLVYTSAAQKTAEEITESEVESE